MELTRVPPGAANWPFHAHGAQWELFIILSGRGEAHQLTNTGDGDLLYYIVAGQPPADVIHYPDSDKWFVKPQRKQFRMQEVDYYDGEDPPAGKES